MSEADTESKLEVVIFSYNKGKYLKNCIESIYENLPNAMITVFDDDSDDTETLEYLNSLGDTVVSTRSKSTARHGNLYKNMQKALNSSSKKFLIFLQDDTQIVRSVTDSDIQNIERVFEDEEVAFLRAHFLKSGTGERLLASATMSPVRQSRIYVPNSRLEDSLNFDAFYDIVICDTVKLKNMSWEFCEGERANHRQAKVNFKYMPVLADSFVSFCPEVPTYRHKKMIWASRIAQRKFNGEISALKTMSDTENSEFTTRNINIWPIAENFLDSTNPNVLKPFIYVDYRRSIFLVILYKLENALFKTSSAIGSFFQ